MRRDNLEVSNPRIYIGDDTIELINTVRQPDEPMSGRLLDVAIVALKTELAETKAALMQAREDFTHLLHRFDKTEELRVRSDRGSLMMLGQIHRDLKGMCGLIGLVSCRKAPEDVREGDVEAAIRVVEDLAAETSNTLAYWRAREGLEMPEYDRKKIQEEHERLLAEARMINARALAHQQQKMPKQHEMER